MSSQTETTFTATSAVPCGECGGDTMAPYRDASGYLHSGHYCEGCGYTTFTSSERGSYADAVVLVQRAAGGVITSEAGDRLRSAVLTHNDGRVRRFLRLAASARDAARDASGDKAEGLWNAWARHLHHALDESWPVDHPAYRRADVV